MASQSINVYSPLVRPLRTITDRSPSISYWQHDGGRSRVHRGFVLCCAAQDSSTATVTGKAPAADKESSAATVTEKKETGPAKATTAPVKPRKAPVKALPQMMEEDVIPSLKSTLEAEEDLSLIELSF